MGNEVDKAAYKLLGDINGVKYSTQTNSYGSVHAPDGTKKSVLDSSDYRYSIMRDGDDNAVASLVDALS